MTKYNEQSVVKAFIAVKDLKRITAIEMAATLDISRTSMGKILTKIGSPSIRLMVKFMNAYPEISHEWIFSGQGQMLKENSELETMVEEMIAEILNLKKEVDTQKEFIDLLKDSRDMYREKIDLLMKK